MFDPTTNRASCLLQHLKDLIAIHCPETGTLQEIGAKVGDVVECVEWKGEYYTVGNKYPVIDRNQGVIGKSVGRFELGRWRIITRASEAKPSPVREVTTRVIPNECIIGHVEVTKHGKVWMRHVTTAADLTAAIATLTEIRDAMKEN